MNLPLAYIDPSASALLFQMLGAVALSCYAFLRRGSLVLRSCWTGDALTQPLPALALAFSFAAVSLLRVFAELLEYTSSDMFEMKSLSPPEHHWAALISMTMIAALAWPLIHLSNEAPHERRVYSILFLFSLLFPLNALREVSSKL